MLKKLDYIFILRPMLFFPGWSTLLAGYFHHSKESIFFQPETIINLEYGRISLSLFAFAAAMGGSFLLNQLRDIESDQRNNKLFFLSKNYVSRKAVYLEILVLVILACWIAANINIGFLSATLGFIFVTGILYNFEPFNLKNKPWGSLVANAIMGWLAFVLGWFASEPFNVQLLTDSLPYLAFNTSLYFFTLLPDLTGDRAYNKNTLAVVLGEKMVIVLAIFAYALSAALTYMAKDLTAFLIVLLALPFYLNVYAKKTTQAAIRTTKYSILMFSLVMCFKIPFYFILMLGIFLFTKWYFRKRFNFDYPNFKGQ